MSLPHAHPADDDRPAPAEPLRALPTMEAEDERLVERQLRDLVERYRLLLDLSPDAVVVHEQGLLRYVNPAGVRFLEAESEDDVVDRPMTEFVDPASIPALLERIRLLDANGDGAVSPPAELTIVGRHGRRMILESTSVRTRWLGRPAYQVILRDTSVRRERAEAEARYVAAVDQLDVGIVVVSADGLVHSMNPAARHLVPGLAVGECSLGPIAALGPHDAAGRPLRVRDLPVAMAFAGGSAGPVDAKVTLPGGVIRWIRADARLLLHDGDPLAVCSMADITAQRRAAEVLEHRARHDALTGLPNRTEFLERLADALGRAVDGRRVAVLFVDLDHFKHVNDAHGHIVADAVMVRVAEVIRAAVGDGVDLARLAGDEFVVLLPDADLVGARNLARSVVAAVSSPIEVAGGPVVRLTASAGVAMADGTVDAMEVLRDADVAMYRAKQRGRDRVQLFDDELRASARRRLEIEDGLRGVLDEGRLLVHHQPVASLETGRITSTEALARWPGCAFPPVEFVPVAEEVGLIGALGSAVLRQACADAVRWRAAQPDLRVAVNLSPSQLADPRLPQHVRDVLDETGLDADGLWLEVTESVLLDAEHGTAALGRLRDLGVHLAIDDFGTGYSSLSYLKGLPVQAVKIDRSFVTGLGADPQDDAIVASVIGLARALRLEVVAEGVETHAQLDALRRLGCDRVQGYLLARPSAFADVDLAATL